MKIKFEKIVVDCIETATYSDVDCRVANAVLHTQYFDIDGTVYHSVWRQIEDNFDDFVFNMKNHLRANYENKNQI